MLKPNFNNCCTYVVPKTKKPTPKSRLSLVVQAERLELSHLTALDPKSSVSTNSTTPAFIPIIIGMQI